MDSYNNEVALLNLLSNPLICEYFEHDKKIDVNTVSFDDVFLSLFEFGKPLLSLHDSWQEESRRESGYQCSLHWNDSSASPLIALGPSPLIAGLRCLMDALYSVRKEIAGEIDVLMKLDGDLNADLDM